MVQVEVSENNRIQGLQAGSNLIQAQGMNPEHYGATVIPLEGSDAGTLGGGTIAAVNVKADDATRQAAVTWIDFYYMQKLIDQGLSPQEIIDEAIGQENWRVLDEMPVEFECSCSKERFINAIASLDPSEIVAMIKEDGGAEADCHFCRNKVWIEKEELQELITH